MAVLVLLIFAWSQVQLNMRAASSTSTSSVGNVGELPSLDEALQGVPQTKNVTIPAKKKSRLDAYDPARFPVLATIDMEKSPIKVGIATISPLVGEAMHFLYDGVVRSRMLQLVGVVSLYGASSETNTNHSSSASASSSWKPNDADLWIVDGARVAKLKRPFLDQILHASNPSWKVLIVDFSDRFQFQLRSYQKLDIWNHKHVRVAARSVVQGRYFDSEANTIVPGRVAPNVPTAGGPTLHAPYAVRTDMVETLQQIMQRRLENSTIALAQAIFDFPTHERPIDVLHLWNISFREGKSKLRNNVSKQVRSWNRTLLAGNHTLVTSIDEQGQRRHVGRNAVDPNYVRALLSAKIVVVTQKDDWEDHYRLFESLICGALVLQDIMVAPPKGLVNGSTIVFFQSLEELEQRIFYYLKHPEERRAIARKGWELAMGRHRSWHRIEELIFGRPLTLVDPNYAGL